MATSFDVIIDRAMTTMRDYKLDRLYQDNEDAFKEIMAGYIVFGVTKFQGCVKPLTYDLVMQEFDADLDMYEVNIIATLTIISWYEDNLRDVFEYKESLRVMLPTLGD